jgi:hypothetical protein
VPDEGMGFSHALVAFFGIVWVMRKRLPTLTVLVSLAWVMAAGAQSGSQQPPPSETPLSFKVLVDQLTSHFPVIKTDIVEVTDGRVILAAGRAEAMQPGVELSTFREGRELYHPTTKKLLGKTEEPLGRIVVSEVFENYSVATQAGGKPPKAGDQARVSAGKVLLTVVPLSSGASARVVDAATQELIQELDRTGRFRLVIGDQVGAYVSQEKISAGDFVEGRGVRAAQERFKITHMLTLHFTTVQAKPWMDVRLYSAAADSALLQTALYVPTSVARRPTRDYSSGGAAGEAKIEKRSLLAKLLSGDFEPHQYSAGASSIPIKHLATYPYTVTSMDVVTAPQDKITRVVVTDGRRVFLYKLENQTLSGEWTYDRLMVGNILNVQLADLNGDGVLEVIVNRQDVKSGMLSYILTTRNDKPVVLAEHISQILLAVDDKGEGVPRTLWGQRYDEEKLFGKGGAKRYELREKNKDIHPVGPAVVNEQFRALGVTFSSVAGKEHRVMAFVDERSRLVIAQGSVQMWRSLTPVGGGLAKAHMRQHVHQTQLDSFINVEPHPLSVDLDGDGHEELVIPINQDEAGRMAVVFKGPAGFRMQVVSSGFEGMITGLGAMTNEAGSLALIAAVVKRSGLVFKDSGDTQIIMTTSD